MKQAPFVSVVLPCLNEEESVPIVLEKIKTVFLKHDLQGEIIVCDNGSTDRSAELARQQGVIVVEEKRRGYGSAYLTGFSHAKGRYLVMGDIDDTYDFGLIPEFLKALDQEGYEFVTGSRYLEAKGQSIPALHRYFGNPMITWILNQFFSCSYTDVYCGFRAFTHDAYSKIAPLSLGMEFNLELAINAQLSKLKIKEIPIELGPRIGTSKLRTFYDGWRSLRMMLLYCPNKLFFIPGLTLFIPGLLLQVLTILKWIAYQGRAFGMVTAFAGSIACISGFKVLSLGLHAKTYSWSRRFEPTNSTLNRFYKTFNLETGALIGSLSILSALATLGVLTYEWLKSGLRPLENPEVAVLAGTLLIIGIEIFFTSFFISAMSIEKRERPWE